MGNYARLRRLWLKDRTVASRDFAAGYQSNGFVDGGDYPLEEMLGCGRHCHHRCGETAAGHGDGRAHRNYKSVTLTQYRRVPARQIQPDLRVRVNARRVYWGSNIPLPGGPAFENFEVRERYASGQVLANQARAPGGQSGPAKILAPPY
jgi:hypothetical protein